MGGSRAVGGTRETHGTRLNLNRFMSQGIPSLDSRYPEETYEFKIGDRVGDDEGNWGKVCQVLKDGTWSAKTVICVAIKNTCEHRLFSASELRFVD